ncbi:hypothetical protein ABZ560_34455, partial [Streptomyces sp. NPDC019208]
RQHRGFSPIAINVGFDVYAMDVLVSLLVFGRISDQVGRRPVSLTALLAQALATDLAVCPPPSPTAPAAGADGPRRPVSRRRNRHPLDWLRRKRP